MALPNIGHLATAGDFGPAVVDQDADLAGARIAAATEQRYVRATAGDRRPIHIDSDKRTAGWRELLIGGE